MTRWTVHSSGVAPEEDINDKYHVAVAVGDSKIYCFGGPYKDVERLQVHVFDIVSLCWEKLPDPTGRAALAVVPSMRFGHSAVLIGRAVYIWGGYWNRDFCDVVYAFDVDAHVWKRPEVLGMVPPATRNHSACAKGTLMYIYGGFNWDGCSIDMYALETAPPDPGAPAKGKKKGKAPVERPPVPLVWSTVAMAPGTPRPASSCHSAAFIGNKMYVFGGRSSLNRVRVFNVPTGRWDITDTAEFLPHSRTAAFVYGGELYAFGGYHMGSGHAFPDDLWRFCPVKLVWSKVEVKGERPPSLNILKPRMCCCLLGERVVALFGGSRGYDTPADDLYVLDMRPDLKTLCKCAAMKHKLKIPASMRGAL